jgi:hypothetical protein
MRVGFRMWVNGCGSRRDDKGTRVDLSEVASDAVRIVQGACGDHCSNLERLSELISYAERWRRADDGRSFFLTAGKLTVTSTPREAGLTRRTSGRS